MLIFATSEVKWEDIRSGPSNLLCLFWLTKNNRGILKTISNISEGLKHEKLFNSNNCGVRVVNSHCGDG